MSPAVTRPLRILTFTTLYPSAARPMHGIFVETRLRHLLARHDVEARVVAPVAWFPSCDSRFGDYARYAATPCRDVRHGIDVRYPRYPLIPKVGMSLAPFGLAMCALRSARALQREGFDFDLIDAHYFYPDGVAAAMIARRLGKPLVCTARGTDINLIPQHAIPRRMIAWAASRCDAIVTVCEALKTAMLEIGIEHPEMHVLRNGVDLELFRPPPDRARLRAELGFNRRTLLSVGYLNERKGHDRVIRALQALPDTELVILGEGQDRDALTALASTLGLRDRVRLPGGVSQPELCRYYGAADALVLASSREGWANVLLESMACGTPVVATPVWGTPEVVAAPDAGRLSRDRSPEALVDGCVDLFDNYPAREATRAYAEHFTWDATSDGLQELFDRLTSGHRSADVALPAVRG